MSDPIAEKKMARELKRKAVRKQKKLEALPAKIEVSKRKSLYRTMKKLRAMHGRKEVNQSE